MSITEQRLKLISAELQRDGRVSVNALAARLSISTETIRRDLKQLELRGEARRVYGGAVTDRRDADQPFADRLRVRAREKARIGAAVAPLIEDGMKIFVDTGTTTLAFARHLLGRPKVGIHTNSIDIAQLLCSDPDADVTVIGGTLRPLYKALFGPGAIKAVEERFFDLAIMGICTVHATHGFMDFGPDEALLRRATLAQSRRSIMLADSSKFGRLGSIKTFELTDVDVLVTDAPLPGDFAAQFQPSKVDVIYA
jgi:DeoR/GlpR family transcriptional regulator of sugar metabolism